MAGPGVQKKDLVILKQLAHVSVLRGSDSTGIFQINTRAHMNKHANELLEKTAADFGYFEWFHRSSKGNGKVLNDIVANVFMGHVRAATIGAVNDDNAHPFGLSNLVGCHNGTLTDKRFLSEDKTDSELMFTEMDKRGVKDVLASLDDTSAYAVTVYDRKTKTITFSRNKKRTLWCAHLKARDVLFWASEKGMLQFVLDRSGEDYDLVYFEVDKLYTLDPRDVKKGKTKIWGVEPLYEPVVVEPKITQNKEVSLGDNVVRLPFFSPKRPVRSVTSHYCNACGSKMDLLAQHFGRQNEDCSWTCEECVDFEQNDPRQLVLIN